MVGQQGRWTAEGAPFLRARRSSSRSVWCHSSSSDFAYSATQSQLVRQWDRRGRGLTSGLSGRPPKSPPRDVVRRNPRLATSRAGCGLGVASAEAWPGHCGDLHGSMSGCLPRITCSCIPRRGRARVPARSCSHRRQRFAVVPSPASGRAAGRVPAPVPVAQARVTWQR